MELTESTKNLLAETVKELGDRGYSLDDVLAVHGDDFSVPIDNFISAANIRYDYGYGSQEIARDLVLRMKDGGLFYRREYDGLEYWKHVPPIPAQSKRIDALSVLQLPRAYFLLDNSLAEMNDPERWAEC